MRVVALIQTRYNSTRLPGKATRLLCGMPTLWHVYRRLLKCERVDEVCCAVGSVNPEPILDVCDKYGMRWKVGEEKNLLTRILETAVWLKADAVVRVTADCVFHDPMLLDYLVSKFKEWWPWTRALSNWPERSVSEGLDAEVYGLEALLELDRDPLCPREDFATYANRSGGLMPCLTWGDHKADTLKLSIDTEDDLERAERIMQKIGPNNFSYDAVVKELA